MQFRKRKTPGLLIGACLATASGAATALDPESLPDESWISLNGTVVSTTADTFRLDYGEGIVTVEMDDWDWYPESTDGLEDKQVTVTGRIDDDLFEKLSIEASTVYVSDESTYYFASPDDEEVDPNLITGYTLVIPVIDAGKLTVSGKVTDIDDREFTINHGDAEIDIDTIAMPYNPLDDEGFQRIKEGDRVSVTGTLDLDFFEDSEIMADYIVTISGENDDDSNGGES